MVPRANGHESIISTTGTSNVCVYSNSRNDVPRVAQRFGTIAAHTRRRASVLVVFVVFFVYMHSFAGLIRRTPPPTFSDTAITDRHSDTTIFQLRAHWVRISWSIGSEKSFRHVSPVGVEPSTSCVQGEHPIHEARLSAFGFKAYPPCYVYSLNRKILNIGTDQSEQTVQIQICLLLRPEQTDQVLHCLQFHLHILHALL